MIGNGGPGSLDLTDWTIEVGFIATSGKFVNRSIITLSDTDTWSAIDHGTLLTFTENNTVGGGLDTEINRVNLLSTLGYAWSNIHINTPGTVTVANPDNFRLNSSNTAFVIKDRAGTIIFGPAGEGIAPLDGVGNTEIFELNNDPSTQISPIDNTTDTTLGYDDGSSGSTFGSPNLFAPIGSPSDRPQDFTVFSPQTSLFDDFLADNGLAAAGPDDDSDSDGFTNLDEYLFGSLPSDVNSVPLQVFDPMTSALTMNIRTNDPDYTLVAEQSSDLQNWVQTDLETADEESGLGPDFAQRTMVYSGGASKIFLRFATSN